MERSAWLAERRRTIEAGYDASAATYDQEDIPITPTHRRFVASVIDRCPSDGRIVDIPCGTGKYFGMILDAGRRAFGVDQSAGMLAAAATRYPDVPTRKAGLHELDFDAEFDAAICVDAMEYVFPEDWPRVLGNLRRAVRPGGPVYLTVETIDEDRIDAAFAEATAAGLPVVRGETSRGGGYHFYPSLEQVAAWIEGAGLIMIEEGRSEGDGYGYHHVLSASG